ncbi:MAG: hypothetical protein PSX79_11960, partial [bacterium]|nr:hypothetical protein [bacterium]
APPRARLWGAIIFGLAALGISVIELPPSTTDGIFLACWASILLTAATVHWPRGRTFVAIALLSVNAGVWAGAVLAATGKPIDRLVALPVVLLCLPGAWLVSRHWGLGVKVLASWLAAVAILGASLPLLTPTPGYVADHME